MKTKNLIKTDKEWLDREDAERFHLTPAPKHAWLKILLVAALTVTLILLAARDARAAGLDEVLQAEQTIDAAKEAKKAAVKRLSKIEKAELRVLLAQRALEKARTAPAKKTKADAE